MRQVLLSIVALLASYALLLMANGMFSTLLSLRTQIEGFSTQVIGLISAGYFLGLMIGALNAVRVVAAVGHIRAFAAFASLVSVIALVHVLYIDPYLWFALRMAQGMCMAGMFMVTEAWINERATNTTRGQILSLYMVVNFSASGSGQLLVQLADPARFQLFSVASILFSFALLPVLMTRATAPAPARPDRIRLLALYRVSPVGFVAATCSGLMNATFYGLGPVFANGIGMDVRQVSFFMASVIMGGLVLQWPVGRLSDRLDRRWVLTGVSFATALGALGILGAGEFGFLWLCGAGVVYGALTFTLYSLAVAHTNDFADPAQRVQTSGGLLIAYGLGAVSGPVIAAFFMGRFGPSAMFECIAVVAAGLGSFVLYRMTRRKAPSREESTPFQAMPQAQFVTDELMSARVEPGDGDQPGADGVADAVPKP